MLHIFKEKDMIIQNMLTFMLRNIKELKNSTWIISFKFVFYCKKGGFQQPGFEKSAKSRNLRCFRVLYI